MRFALFRSPMRSGGHVIACRPSARAAFIVNVDQVGPDVVMTGSGTLNTNALFHLDIGGVVGAVHASRGELYMGPTSNSGVNVLSGVSDRATSARAGFSRPPPEAATPRASPATCSSQRSEPWRTPTRTTAKTLSSMGLTPGTYVWNWGSGTDADSFTVNINAIVPEPASLSLLGIAGLAMLRRAKRPIRQ